MPLTFNPPLLNSANPWATTKEDLQALYDCPFTGAITIRTSVFGGFEHDDGVHQYAFFGSATSSLNTLGYSPIPFQSYISIIHSMLSSDPREGALKKPIIFSVTGTSSECQHYHHRLRQLQAQTQSRILMEINLSCPNIPGKEPPAYSHDSLVEYLRALELSTHGESDGAVEVGIKVPPYTHASQYQTLISSLLSVKPCPLAFITSTNTLGSCLLLSPSSLSPVINSETGTGVGGLAGEALHPLALGNVRTIRGMLDMHESLKGIGIIGVGGVADGDGFRRMRAVGAEAVGVGTALGKEGVGVFERILRGGGEMEKRAGRPVMVSKERSCGPKL